MRSPNPKGARRAQEDHLFDRREVEAPQGAQLTRTNRPFGLTIRFTQRFFASFQFKVFSFAKKPRTKNSKLRSNLFSSEASSSGSLKFSGKVWPSAYGGKVLRATYMGAAQKPPSLLQKLAEAVG